MKSKKLLQGLVLQKLVISLVLITGIISCQKELHFDKVPEKDHNLVLKFKPIVQYDSNKLAFGTAYSNFFKESFTVTGFKFYIHNVQLINTDSNKVFELSADKYFLIDFSDSAKCIINMAVLPYTYNRIAFTVGIDSARNVSGAQTGALDPANGMFWTWNTGYIMAKLEGTSPVAAGGRFEYHIGGFQEPDNVLKKITLLFPFAQNIDLKPGETTEMDITADAYDWFNNPHDIRLNTNPVIATPGSLAKEVAENYSKMFTVVAIINE
jgi:hypothetical protein